MKKSFDLDFGRRPQYIIISFFRKSFILFALFSSCFPYICYLGWKKAPCHKSASYLCYFWWMIFFFNNSFIEVESRVHAEIQLSTFVILWDSYEDDLWFGFMKRTSIYYNCFHIYLLFWLKSWSMPKISFLPLLFLEIALKKTFDFKEKLKIFTSFSSINLLFRLKAGSMQKKLV